jgi:hypothetical protein
MATTLVTEKLFDLQALQRLFEYYWVNERLCFDLVDEASGELLLAVGLHPACARYHAADRMAELACKDPSAADADRMITCCIGLTSIAAPIVVGANHVATLFVGPAATEPVDKAALAEQARHFGLEETFWEDFRRIARSDRKTFAARTGSLVDIVTRMASQRAAA